MLMSLLSHILIGYFCFALPSFATFKALSHRPLSEPDLERWTTYWAVVGVFLSLETGFEFFISWLPFYWEIKTAFLLFLALPQTEGSTYIYQTYLRPFFSQNEVELDRGIGSIQKSTVTFLQARLSQLFEIVMRLINNKNGAAQPQHTQSGQQAQNDNPLGAALGMFKAYNTHFGSGAQDRAAPVAPNTQAYNGVATSGVQSRAAPVSPNLQSRKSGVSPIPSPLPTPNEPIGAPMYPATRGGMHPPVIPSFPEPEYD
ncbi:TB2/DP1, HVA22 family-domain-containing protein [Pterulicium gracile]|uniref:Protein YOP1 n=1 Tax=Pterulicium gracile TaxID=1884261 RepID=A0A5C3QZZ5_9AGAR|nr:TB2/DP1, HVA22 family-domain-containing protein [Pterula gracilis]